MKIPQRNWLLGVVLAVSGGSACSAVSDFDGYVVASSGQGGIVGQGGAIGQGGGPGLGGNVGQGGGSGLGGNGSGGQSSFDALPMTDGPCVVAAGGETCNGRDDDCNGMTDEGLGKTTCGMGACERSIDNCAGGVAQVCAPGLPAAAEMCNALDDDCNGMTDDGLGTTTCGMGVCARTVNNCMGGVAQACAPGPAAAEICNALDDNCNGATDDGLGMTTCGMGICARTVDNCRNGMAQACVPGPAGVESCNALDDNCNGATDEALGTTTCGVGECRRTVQNCTGGMAQACVGGQPSREICGDRLDNDCNGTTDAVPLLLLGDANVAMNSTLAQALNNAGFSTSIMDSGVAIYAGSPAASSFRAIIATTGDLYSSMMPAPGQQAIVNARAASGTGVVLTEWAAYMVQTGQWPILAPLVIVPRVDNVSCVARTYTRLVNHPIWAGIPDGVTITPSLQLCHNVASVTLGTAIARTVDDGGDVIAVHDSGTSRIVQFAHSAGYQQEPWVNDPNLLRFMINGAQWAAHCEP